jgi:hypothetical protein
VTRRRRKEGQEEPVRIVCLSNSRRGGGNYFRTGRRKEPLCPVHVTARLQPSEGILTKEREKVSLKGRWCEKGRSQVDDKSKWNRVKEGKEGKEERVYVSRLVISPLRTLTLHLIPCILLP